MASILVDRSKVPLVAVVGLGFLAGAAVLAWLSAVATMTIERRADGLQVTVERRLLGFVPAGCETLGGIRRIESVSGRLDSRSNTPNQLVFMTADGVVRQGYDTQRFLRDYPDLREFVDDASRSTFVRSSTHRGDELVRFLVAQAIALLLAMLGAWLVVVAVRAWFPDPREGIGPE